MTSETTTFFPLPEDSAECERILMRIRKRQKRWREMRRAADEATRRRHRGLIYLEGRTDRLERGIECLRQYGELPPFERLTQNDSAACYVVPSNGWVEINVRDESWEWPTPEQLTPDEARLMAAALLRAAALVEGQERGERRT